MQIELEQPQTLDESQIIMNPTLVDWILSVADKLSVETRELEEKKQKEQFRKTELANSMDINTADDEFMWLGKTELLTFEDQKLILEILGFDPNKYFIGNQENKTSIMSTVNGCLRENKVHYIVAKPQ